MKKSAFFRSPITVEAMKKTNFDDYLDEQMRDQAFAARFEQAGEAWDVAIEKQVRCVSKI